MTDKTTFTFHISQQAETSLKIYSINGRLLKSFEPALTDIGFNVFPEIWDGTDQQGDKLANGVYLYKLKAKSYWDEKTSHAEKIGKLIIAR
jgi:flagellar hook assembly protein FlgD